MKFRIRYADQIVGLLVILALGSLIAVIFLLGSQQRWFSRDYQYKTYAATASGLGVNMPVLLKGIQIGAVKRFNLTDDDKVEVNFTIYSEYNDKVKLGSLIQIVASPIGLGTQFNFYPGLGSEPVEEFDLIPTDTSAEGRRLNERGLSSIPVQSDTIAILISKVNNLLDSIQITVNEVNLALQGNEKSVLGRTLGLLPAEMEGIHEIIQDIAVITGQLQQPDGVLSLLDGKGELVTGLKSSMNSLSGILSNLEKTSAYIPRELPSLITDIRGVLQTAEDVLIALRNNPLLKNGVPERVETGAGTNPRGVTF